MGQKRVGRALGGCWALPRARWAGRCAQLGAREQCPRAAARAEAGINARAAGRWGAGWARGWAAARDFPSFDIFDLFDPFCPIFPCLLTFSHLFINLFVMYCFKYSSLSL